MNPAPPSDAALMPPPPARPPKRKAVLLEDDYTGLLEEIIERDFFPDLARLRSRLEWLEASRSGDPEVVRAAQLSIQARLLDRTPAGRSVGTPSFGTPRSSTWSAASTPARGGGPAVDMAAAAAQLGAAGEGVYPGDLRLDDFLARYTSEDNASFEDLLAKVNAKRAQRALPAFARASAEAAHSQRLALLSADAAAAAASAACELDGEAAAEAQAAAAASRGALLTPSSIDGGAGGSGQRVSGQLVALERPLNNLFFVPDGPPVAPPARAGSVAARNTRFHSEDRPPSGYVTPAYSPAAARPGAAKPYSRLATPMPSPGASPFMTWGRLDATPLRLEEEDGELEAARAAALGRRFTIAPPDTRDRVGAQLAHQAGQATARRGGGATPARQGGALSEAALRLLRSQRKGRDGGVDEALRRSYTPGHTPARSAGVTPAGTPRAGGAAGGV